MPTFRKIYAALILAISCSFANTASASTTFNTTIVQVYSNDTQLLIKLASGQTGEGCTDNSLAVIDKAAANWEQKWNLALAAYLSGKPVQVRINGCAYYPKVHYIWMR